MFIDSHQKQQHKESRLFKGMVYQVVVVLWILKGGKLMNTFYSMLALLRRTRKNDFFVLLSHTSPCKYYLMMSGFLVIFTKDFYEVLVTYNILIFVEFCIILFLQHFHIPRSEYFQHSLIFVVEYCL